MTLKPGTFLQNRYEILKVKGVGGMSVVYKARCHKLNRFVAIKVLKEEFTGDEEFVAKFKMEAQAAASLIHPNIVNMYDVVDEGDLHYIVMEYIEGVTLKTYIASRKQLSPNAAVSITLQIAQAINVAHKQHIIHRDIKPQNILITQEGKIKVADFGIARAVSKQTIGKSAMGSVHYFSPEQARGEILDERSDIYSLGISMYEMLTGKVPFEGDNAVNIAIAQIEKPITLPSMYNKDISVEIENIILKCVQKRKEMRYQSISELIKDLISTLPSQQKPTPAQEKEVLDGTRQFSSAEIGLINARTKHTHQRPVVEDLDDEESEREATGYQRSPKEQRKRTETYPEKYEDWYEDDDDLEEDVKVAAPRRVSSSGKQVKPNPNDDFESRPKKRRGDLQSQPKVHNRPDDDFEEEDRNRRLEKWMAIAGVVLAVIIVSVLAFFFFKIGDALGLSVRKPSNLETTLASNQVHVPDILGLDLDFAEKKLKENNLQIHVEKEEYHDTVEKGHVISQDPVLDEVVSKYTKVNVVVSLGSDKVDLSKLGLERMKAEDAKSTLEGMGFSVRVEEEEDETVVKDFVVRYSPDKPERGSLVVLVKSLGKAKAKALVPTLIARSEDNAKFTLLEAGFQVGIIRREFSDAVEKGYVISQDIEPNTEAEAGTLIGFVVSDGVKMTEAATTQETTLSTMPPETIGSTQSPTQQKIRYTASINETFSLKNQIGPGASNTSYSVTIRLKQNVNGNTVVTTLMEPRKISGDTILPVRYSIIEGADGVESGTLEIVKIDDDNTQHVLKTYDLLFFPGR